MYFGQSWGGDFSGYIMQGMSLVEGTTDQVIEQNRFTVENSSRSFAPIAYPWGYPYLIALVYALFGIDLVVLKTINIFLYLFFLIILFRLFRERLSLVARIALVAIFAVNPSILLYLNHILSDILFLTLSTLAVLLMDRIVIKQRVVFSRLVDHILLGAVISGAFLVRLPGLLLLITLFCCQVIQTYIFWRRPENRQEVKIIFQFIPYLVFVGIYFLTPLADYPGVTIANTSSIAKLWIHNFRLPVTVLLPSYIFHSNIYKLDINTLIYILSLPFTLVGVIANWRKDYHFILYIGLLSALLTWFSAPALRYIFPILPFYVYFTFAGLKWLLNALPKQYIQLTKVLAYAVYLAVLLRLVFTSINYVNLVSINGNANFDGPYSPISAEIFDFISKNTTPESVVIFFKPRVLRMFTQRNTFTTQECVDLERGDYLVIHK
ncbi:glycosyltransferase family 39 protein, partial [Chloroflexota bacterium]